MNGVEGNIYNHSTQDAQNIGIATVYQEVNLCPNLSENLFIGREPLKKGGAIDWKEMNRRAKEIMEGLNIPIDVTKTLENYSIAIQQMIAIARAVDMECRVLILDDFLANGKAMKGLLDVCNQAGCSVAGIGICIEKGFQPGGAELRAAGYKLASLAIVNEMSDDHLTFREQ